MNLASVSVYLAKMTKWEYWPAWLIYAPIVPHCVLLSLRYRGLTLPTAVNPCIPLSGLVGESKAAILNLIPQEWIVTTEILTGPMDAEQFARRMQARGMSFPIILKPDVGERGQNVKLIKTPEAAQEYLTHAAEDVAFPIILQAYHPGPFEAGIFYFRRPDETHGRIFSITEKIFATVVGDGRASLRDLILQHPRHRFQSRVFFDRLGGNAERVPQEGEIVRLNIAGNHCQGAMFLDGKHLWSRELETRLDEIARSMRGFYFGRFDIRYENAEALRRGERFAIVELNGVLSESTDMYDPSQSFWGGQKILRRQWSAAFQIGHQNRARGAKVASCVEIVKSVLKHRQRRVQALSD